jgi:hypothetical protein
VPDETVVAETWLYSVLTTDATLTGLIGVGEKVHAFVAPKGTPPPFVVYQYQGGNDVRGVGPVRIMTGLLYVVKAVTRSKSFSDLKPIAERINVLLHAQHGEAAGGRVVSCVREQPFKLVETSDGGVPFRHLGGIYRINAQ